MAKINDLFLRRVERRINPAVVVSEMEDFFIKQEIEEYVFTTGLAKNVHTFLDAVANKKEGKTGIWINGYYGSGKSHFIKYLFYCLSQQYGESALKNFSDAVVELPSEIGEGITPAKAVAVTKSVKKLQVDEIIFNIDAVSDHKGEKDRITRVFLNQLNKFRGYNDSNIALALNVEKELSLKGLFEKFKERVERDFGEKWDGNQHRFTKVYIDKVLNIAKELNPDMSVDSLKSDIMNKDQDYRIDHLINELSQFVATKEDDYKLVFLIDEVSQYIGSNSELLLNLQTIVEEIGSQIGTKVWVVCTAQQSLESLIDANGNDTQAFGKILGRFETRISLESQDAAYITKKRVLDKSDKGLETLIDYHKSKVAAIENQFVFNHDLYENYGDRQDFTVTYPFVPYQFRLVSDVFESFSNVGYVGEGVKNTERAILGITHYTVNLCTDKDVGYFVPFDLFFNEQLEKNLTQRARNILDRAYNIEKVRTEEFARRVVNALFMISNLGETIKVNFPANIENLALLLMESVDTPKLEMQEKVEQVLDVLIKNNIVQVSEGKYRFLTDAQVQIATQIRQTTITNEDKLSYFYKDILAKVIKINPSIADFSAKSFKYSLNIDEKEELRTGDFNVRFNVFDTDNAESVAMKADAKNMVVMLSEELRSDKDLLNKILDYVRTQKFIYSANKTGAMASALNHFRETNEVLLNEIKLRVEKMIMSTPMVSKNMVIAADDLNGSTATARFSSMLNKHLTELYHKNHLSKGLAETNRDVTINARSRQQGIPEELTAAEEVVETKLQFLGDMPVLIDVIKDLERDPYGWKDLCTIDALVMLAKRGLRRFEYKSEPIELVDFVEKALNTRERDSLTIHKEKVHSKEEVSDFINAVNDAFNETIIASSTSDLKTAIESFEAKMKPKLAELNTLKNGYDGYPFTLHIRNFYEQVRALYETRNPDKLVEAVLSQKNDIKSLRDTYMYASEFIEHNFKAYEGIKEFVDDNKGNFDSLDEELAEKAKELKQYLTSNTEPWDTFPAMKKKHKMLRDAIANKLDELRNEAKDQYTQIFEQIAERAEKLNVTEPNITTSSEYYLNKIQTEKRIDQVKIYLLEASQFRANNLKKLEEFAAKQKAKKDGTNYVTSIDVSIAAEMPPTTIETPEQLDDYIKKLRERLMVKLGKNKKIFIN